MRLKFAKIFLVKEQTLLVLFDPFTKARTIGKNLLLQGLIKMSNTNEIMSLSGITGCLLNI